jgi:hypothetical protein
MGNLLTKALSDYENRIKGKFKPDRRFYVAVNINQKRFGQLVKDKADFTRSEILALSNFFGVPPISFLEETTALTETPNQ